MALESDNKVPSTSNSYCDNYCDDDDDDNDDDENSIASKLMHKYTSLLCRKKFYKDKFNNLTKKFESLKNEFFSLTI